MFAIFLYSLSMKWILHLPGVPENMSVCEMSFFLQMDVFLGHPERNYINELPTTILLYFYFIQKFAYYFLLVEWTRACACAILCYCLFVMLATFAKMCLSISYCSQTLFVLEVYHSQMYTNQNEIFLHFNLKQK